MATVSLKELMASEDIEAVVENISFENGIQLMGELVEQVESGSLPLDKAISSYEKGVHLIERLRGLLAGAEQKLEVLKQTGSTQKKAKKNS